MNKGEYREKLSELIRIGVITHMNKQLTPPLNTTVGGGMIIPFIGLIATMAMNWEDDKDGKLIDDAIERYKRD